MAPNAFLGASNRMNSLDAIRLYRVAILWILIRTLYNATAYDTIYKFIRFVHTMPIMYYMAFQRFSRTMTQWTKCVTCLLANFIMACQTCFFTKEIPTQSEYDDFGLETHLQNLDSYLKNNNYYSFKLYFEEPNTKKRRRVDMTQVVEMMMMR